MFEQVGGRAEGLVLSGWETKPIAVIGGSFEGKGRLDLVEGKD